MKGLAGRYQIEKIVAEGGMGRVYKARRKADGKPVAIKVLHQALEHDQRFRSLMDREAQALEAAAHPCVVGLLDKGEVDGLPYLVLEWLEGRTLRQVIEEDGPPSMARMWRIMDGLLAALQWVHTRGVVHADLKPENVIITKGGRVVLIDFGVASVGRLAPAWPGEVCGTPGYLAPEALTGAPPPTSADVYAAGAILFELLTGQAPFAGSVTEIIHQQLGQAPPRASSLRNLGPHAVDHVVERALARRPQDRYASAFELRGALALALSGRRRGHAPASRAIAAAPTIRLRRRGDQCAAVAMVWG